MDNNFLLLLLTAVKIFWTVITHFWIEFFVHSFYLEFFCGKLEKTLLFKFLFMNCSDRNLMFLCSDQFVSFVLITLVNRIRA